jgi:hypothetical protein|tara:strand:+ start:595 stop:786 length:192 start_codon:yes stop_codon:yes gene_type:complete
MEWFASGYVTNAILIFGLIFWFLVTFEKYLKQERYVTGTYKKLEDIENILNEIEDKMSRQWNR